MLCHRGGRDVGRNVLNTVVGQKKFNIIAESEPIRNGKKIKIIKETQPIKGSSNLKKQKDYIPTRTGGDENNSIYRSRSYSSYIAWC